MAIKFQVFPEMSEEDMRFMEASKCGEVKYVETEGAYCVRGTKSAAICMFVSVVCALYEMGVDEQSIMGWVRDSIKFKETARENHEVRN